MKTGWRWGVAGLAIGWAFNSGAAPAAEGTPAQPPPALAYTVTATRVLSEAALVGPYQQPEWTLHRRFPTTRVYLQEAPGELAVEQWWRSKYYDDGYSKQIFREEAELGLPCHFQLDLYFDTYYTPPDGYQYQDTATELRWSPADWGVIPLNPTAYFEWKFMAGDQGPDVWESKLLFGDQIGQAWHWGANLIWEQETAEARETELAASAALSYTIADGVFSAGIEAKYAEVSAQGARGDPTDELQAGPSLQWRLSPRLHLDLVALAGLTEDAPNLETFVVMGYDVKAKPRSEAYTPVSTRAE